MQLVIFHGTKQGFIIFINYNDNFSALSLMQGFNETDKTSRTTTVVQRYRIFSCARIERYVNYFVKCIYPSGRIITRIEIDIYYRMLLPFPFKGINRESGPPGCLSEQFPFVLKYRSQSRTQQRLPEPPGPGKKERSPGTCYQLVNPGGFVNITKTFFADTYKVLYAYG